MPTTSETRKQVKITIPAHQQLAKIVDKSNRAGSPASQTSIVSNLLLDIVHCSLCNICQSQFVVIQNGKRVEPEFCPDCGFKISNTGG